MIPLFLPKWLQFPGGVLVGQASIEGVPGRIYRMREADWERADVEFEGPREQKKALFWKESIPVETYPKELDRGEK